MPLGGACQDTIYGNLLSENENGRLNRSTYPKKSFKKNVFKLNKNH